MKKSRTREEGWARVYGLIRAEVDEAGKSGRET